MLQDLKYVSENLQDEVHALGLPIMTSFFLLFCSTQSEYEKEELQELASAANDDSLV